MKKAVFAVLALVLAAPFVSCSTPAPTAAPTATPASCPLKQVAPDAVAAKTAGPSTPEQAIDAANIDGLKKLVDQYKAEKDYELLYLAASRLAKLEPKNTDAYIDAVAALFELSKANYEEINSLLAKGGENAGDASALAEWVRENEPDLEVVLPGK